MIDIRQLTYFVAVVEAKSFTAAAELLCIAQPALSQHLQRLEHEFGHQLLVRHSKGVRPTAAGQRLIEHARSILTLVETTKVDLRNFDERPSGQVRLGLPPSLCDVMAAELLLAWREAHPNIHLRIVEQPSNALLNCIQADRLDLAVTSYPADESHSLIGEPLLRDRLCAIVPRAGHRSVPGEIPFADLATQPLILHSQDNVSRQLIDLSAKYASVDLNVRHEIDSPLLALQLVEAGVGATIQPYLAVRNYMKSGRAWVRPICAPTITRRLHLIRSRRRPLSPHELQVAQALKSHLSGSLAAEHPLVELDASPETGSHSREDGASRAV